MSTATDMLAAYIAAETAVLGGQAYTIAGRSMTRANLKEIRDGVTYWQNKVNVENAASKKLQSLGGNPFSVVSFNQQSSRRRNRNE